jgi:hypothetical protein
MAIQAGGGNIPQQTFAQFNDPNGTKLIALNRDGTILTQGINFADGTIQATSGIFVSGAIQTSSGSFPANLKGDGVTDNTAAINAALLMLFNAGGGTLIFPIGTFLVLGQINIPNDGGSAFNNAPMQPSIRITGSAAAGGVVPWRGTGAGNSLVTFQSGPADGGSVLLLNYNSPTAKICTFGTGMLEIDRLTLADNSTDSATFFFTSNTVCHIHDVTFLGNTTATASISSNNDAIWLGNNFGVANGTFNAPFQGYGTSIKNCYFQNIKRAVFGQAYANGVFVTENTIWSSCGNHGGAAIVFGTNSFGSGANSNYICGNLAEVLYYKYFIQIIAGMENKIIGNDSYDPIGGTFTASVRFEASAFPNFVIAGFSGGYPYVSDVPVTSTTPGLNTYIGTPGSSQINFFATPIGVTMIATAALTAGQIVKIDPANTNAVIVCTTADTGGGIPIGIAGNSAGAGQNVYVITEGLVRSGLTFSPILGTGTATPGQFVIVDTTTNGRVKTTSTYTAGTVIGTVVATQASVGNPVGLLMGLR